MDSRRRGRRDARALKPDHEWQSGDGRSVYAVRTAAAQALIGGRLDLASEPGGRKQRRHRVGEAGETEQAAAIGRETLAVGVRRVARRATMLMRPAIRMDMRDGGIGLVDVAAALIETMGGRGGICERKRSVRSKNAQSVERSEGKRRSEPKSLGKPRQHRAIRTSRRQGMQGQSRQSHGRTLQHFLGRRNRYSQGALGLPRHPSRCRESRCEQLQRRSHPGAEPPFRIASPAARPPGDDGGDIPRTRAGR